MILLMENAEYLRTTLYTSTTNFLCDYFESFGVVTTEPYARVVGIQIEDEEPLWTQRDISDLPVPKTPGMESCFEEGRNDPEPVTYEMPTEKAIRLTSYYKQCLIEEPSDIDTTNCHHFTHEYRTDSAQSLSRR